MSPCVAVQYAPDSGRAGLSNNCARIVLGVPGVHDDGSPRLGGERHLCGERVSLSLAGRIVVVVVETTLSYGDGASPEQLAQLRNIAARIKPCGIVRMDPSCRENKPRIFSRAGSGDRRGIE